jgi:hypothetical protein
MNKPRAYTDSQDSSCPELGEATTFPLIVLFVIRHEGCIQMSFCLKTPKLENSQVGSPEIPKIGILGTLEVCRPKAKL